jgi:O-antigen/teichoic acid export membrane protein
MAWTREEWIDFAIGAVITVGIAALGFGANYASSDGGKVAALAGGALTTLGIIILLFRDRRENSPTKWSVLLAVLGGIAAAIDGLCHGHLAQIVIQMLAGIALISYGWFARGLEEKRRAKATQSKPA